MRPSLTRLLAVVAACGLVAAPVAVLASAQAAVPSASVPVTCADSVSSLTVFVDDVVSFGPVPPGCTVLSNSATGNLDRVSGSGFVAFAVGTGAVFQLMTDGTLQYLVKVDVTIVDRPVPSPTPTSTQASGPTPSASTAGGDPAVAPTTRPEATETATPLTAATGSEPRRWQELQRREIFAQPGDDPAGLVVLSENGNPLQVLSVQGPAGAVELTSQGMDFARPENWQFLQYGDLCWGYRGFEGAQALMLPVAEPPFRTLAAQWTFRSAIVGTSSGNVTVLDPAPGDVVDAGGRDITTLTLCANGTATEAGARSKPQAPGGGGGGHSGGYGTDFGWVPGCKNAGPQQRNPHCHPGLEGPFTIVEPTTSPSRPPSTGTPSTAPSASPAATDDRIITYCRATQDASRPYVLDRAPISELPVAYNRPYPMDGWTSIIPPRSDFAGQNWPEGQDTLYAKRCVVPPYVPPTQVVATPTPTPSTVPTPTVIATPTPDPQLTPTPRPTVTVTPDPQVIVIGFGPVQPWPPLIPIPVPLSQVTTTNATPTPYPTPTPTTASPVASPYATPTPSPYATPTPTPTPYPTPVATPYLVPVPMLVTPTRAPQPAKDPLITLPSVTASPTATPTVPTSTTATDPATPTATPTTTLTASPTATPTVPTSTTTTDPATPSAVATPGGSASPSPEASAPTDAGAETMVTLVLTNGPDTITVVRPYAVLQQKAVSAGGTTPERPSGGKELANTGSPWTAVGTVALAMLGMAFVLLPRIARREDRP